MSSYTFLAMSLSPRLYVGRILRLHKYTPILLPQCTCAHSFAKETLRRRKDPAMTEVTNFSIGAAKLQTSPSWFL